MADDQIRNDNNNQTSENQTKLSSRKLSNSLMTSIKNVSNIYERESKIYSKIAGQTPIDDEIKFDGDQKNNEKKLMDAELSYSKTIEDEGTSFWGTLIIYIKVNVVAGFLFLPHGFYLGGWLFSVLSLILVALITGYCNIALASCADEVNSYSFTTIGTKAFGKCGRYIVDYGIAISQICFPCSYSNLIATVIGKLLNAWFGYKEDEFYWYIGIVLFIILIPMCYLRNISAFTQMHIIGDLAVLATITALFYDSISRMIKNDEIDIGPDPLIRKNWSKMLGMAISCLEGVGVILPIKESMREKDQFNKVVYVGMFIIVSILIGFPLVAFFSYGITISEIVIANLNFEKSYIAVVMILLVFSIIVVYPVQLNPAFRIFESNFIQCKTNVITYENIIRTSILALTVAVGISSINKFANLMALAACAVCTPIALILPSIFHYQLFKGKQSLLRSCVDIFIAFLGVGISLTILTFTAIQWND